ncbi:MAG: YegS/Rv2252/BmrU family lipid kinase [Erysipelotrichaceae bacterium]|nr:YegS/Rv2252/BmrU family lipid kinase [Erysipelotrichaceae bacterium]
MKHVFIVNPAAGKQNSLAIIKETVSKLGEIDSCIYETKSPGDATEYIRKLCRENESEQYTFYACGGDGTINEVANGVFGYENARMTAYPVGSGNDYVKYFGGKEKFLDLEKLINGEEILVDVLKVKDHYALNAVHFGFDTVVLRTMIQVKRKPIIGGNNAYYTGVIKGLFSGLNNKCLIKVDGEAINDGNFMMCTVCNGTHVGGSFKSAPRSVVNDGFAEVCCFKVIPKYKIPFLIGKYMKGTHLEDPECLKYLVYKRAKTVELIAPEPMDISVDGELMTDSHFIVENLEKAIRFVAPKE